MSLLKLFTIDPNFLSDASGVPQKLLYPLVVWTTFRYALQAFSLNKLFFDSVVNHRRIHFVTRTCLPICGGIFGMQLLQEVVHYLVAKWRSIKIGLPTPIPSFEIGTFGCVTPIKSFPPNRAALLDFALSGPFATTIASLGCIIASALLTVRASPAALAKFPVLPAIVIKSSFLAGTLISWIASKVLMLPPAQPIPIHPLFLVGYAGLIASGLNLLPVRWWSSMFGCYGSEAGCHNLSLCASFPALAGTVRRYWSRLQLGDDYCYLSATTGNPTQRRRHGSG